MSKRDPSRLTDEEDISEPSVGQKRNRESMQEMHSEEENTQNKVEFEKHYKMSDEKHNWCDIRSMIADRFDDPALQVHFQTSASS